MFIELLDKNSDFYKNYMRSFSSRSSSSSILMETGNPDDQNVESVVAENNYMNALDWIFEIPFEKKLSPYDMADLISIMTNGEYDNFRTSEAMVIGSKVERSKPALIRNDLYYLLDNYYNVWSDLDVFEKEAMFHINFLIIHPFGDGNGRLARLITSYNLIKQNTAPVVIPRSRKSEYCNYIENRDYKGLSKMFKELSCAEMLNLNGLYENYTEGLGKKR